MIETRSNEVFSELNDAKLSNRDGSFECGSKCIDCKLVTEGLLNTVEDIELIKWNGIVDSDHRGHLTDLSLEVCFEEEFEMEKVTEHRSLNPHERNHIFFLRKLWGITQFDANWKWVRACWNEWR